MLPDLENKAYILSNGGVAFLYECLLLDDEAAVISAITTLMFLITPESKSGKCVVLAHIPRHFDSPILVFLRATEETKLPGVFATFF